MTDITCDMTRKRALYYPPKSPVYSTTEPYRSTAASIAVIKARERERERESQGVERGGGGREKVREGGRGRARG